MTQKRLKDSDLVKKRKARVQVDKLKRQVGEKKSKEIQQLYSLYKWERLK